ncbi:MAG: M48 family metalloprotease [Saccharospirillum sp.]
MATRHYHLVCQGFRDASVNKTELSLALKTKLKLNDAQVADLMAARRVILVRNLPADKAQALGRKLTRAGLNIRAEGASAHQKLSADELRQHLLDGGLSQYFAGRYRHPEDELETRISLVIMALVPILAFLLLPLIGLLLLRPLLALHIWSGQFIAALGQLLLALLLFVPAAALWPGRRKPHIEGIELDPETEQLLYAMVDEVSQYLTGPSITTLVLTEGPLVRLRQTPLQWARGEATLEIGLAHLQAVNLQQFVGSLVHQLTPHSPAFYYWCWSLYLFWANALERRVPRAFYPLQQWLQPMHDHQRQRQSSSVQALIGPREAMRLNAFYQQLDPIQLRWETFSDYCAAQQRTPTGWPDWLHLPGNKATEPDTADDEQAIEGQFRMNAPAEWALSNSAGYARALARKNPPERQPEPAQSLWQAFRQRALF